MNTNINSMEGVGEKRLSETSGSGVSHNLTTMQGMQSVQNIVQSNVQTIQPAQSVIGTVAGPSTLVGKSVSLDLNPKLSLMKPVVQAGVVSSTEASKITTTLCSVGSTVRIISPGMLGTVERQTQPQNQQQTQQVQQIVTSIPPATYHVPRGPAAVANIAAPRSTVATPIGRACTGQPVSISRPGINTTATNPQWQSKTASVVYAQPQRHSVPPGSRITTRPPAAVYSGQQPRLITPPQGRPVQATMVTGVQGTPSRLIAPVLQSNNNITRIPVAQVRPPTPQSSSITTTVQPGRPLTQPLQTSRPIPATGTVSRIAVTPVIGSTTRITTAASVTVQPTIAKQLTINPTTGASAVPINRIVIPPQQVQQQPQPQGVPRVVQTVGPLANIGTISRVIATTAGPAANVTRVTQPAPTPIGRIPIGDTSRMALHSLQLAPTRTTPTPVKTIPTQSIAQTVQIKPLIQQQPGLRITPGNSGGASSSGSNSNNNTTPSSNSNNSNNIVTGTPQAVQSLYLNSPQTTTTYYSVESSVAGVYSPYRPATVQPVRLLVEPTGYEETHTKPNASPRPSILRKRDHDSSPAKGAAKNLVPVLAALPSVASICSPPGSPRGDRDGGQSSGSTTVSATSSPGLDEEPEQSRITINQTMEMSPRKKPRKQQLTGVELMEPRCNDEEMQFITEEKMNVKEEPKDKYGMERKQISNIQQHDGRLAGHTPAVVLRSRPTPSLLASAWKNRWGSRLHHYRRPSDVRPREERRPTVAELAQQKHVLQKINGWKVYHLTAQMEDLAELEKQVHEKLKTTLVMLESQQIGKNRQDDGLERANELIKGNMQRSSLISEGMNEARTQLVTIFQHKRHVTDILQRCGNKRAQKKRDK